VSALARAVRARTARHTQLAADPLSTFRPLPGQYALLSDPGQYRLFRGPNQALGKTTAGAVDTLCSAIGRHPWCPEVVTDEPGEWWVICASWSQSVVIQQKMYDLAPKELLHPETEFHPLRGFRGKNPAFRVRHLPSGGWSTIRIKTTNQGGLMLASATLTGAWFDEPPSSPRIFSEVQKRVLRAGRKGRILLTMTPVNARVDWIREMTETGILQGHDHHHRLEPGELIPVGSVDPIRLDDGTFCDEAWVESQIAQTLPHEVPVVCHGEWSMAAEAPIFTAYRDTGPDAHVSTEIPTGDVELVLGIDHGVRAHTQTAVLCAVMRDGEQPRVWVLDEYVSPGETTEDDDARAILDMLESHGQRWDNLSAVWGDRAHHGSSRKFSIAAKSNSGLMRALERLPGVTERHGIRRGLVHPPIRSAKKGVAGQPGSVSYGCTWLHKLMLRPATFYVHPRCGSLRTGLQGYDMTPNSKESHIVDALRYALRGHIFARTRDIPRQTVQVH
jgi:hypothetical protein